MEVCGVFFDVSFEWDEVLVDEVTNFLVRIGLGLQPSAGASGGSCAEINEDRLVGLLRLGQRCVRVFIPVDCHVVSSLLALISTASARCSYTLRK